MIKGIALGFLAYGLFSCGDASVKALGGHLSVFEIGFFSSLIASVVVAFGAGPGERWRDMFRMKHPLLVLLRAGTGLSAGVLGIVAFTTLPFAEAYAMIFLVPAFVTLFSIWFLGEEIGWRRWLAVAVGFAGILLVVRPGFRQVMPGHLAALLVAVSAAVTVLVLRHIGRSERRVSLIGVTMLVGIVFNGAMTAASGSFVWPDGRAWIFLAMAGGFAGLGQLALLGATRLAPANRVAPAQYSQIVWAVTIGAVFYFEFPDALALLGMGLVVLSGAFTFVREQQMGQPSTPVPGR